MIATEELAPLDSYAYGWEPGAVGSSTLSERYGIASSSRLLSWQRAGWVAPTRPPRGTGYPLWWSPPAQRMVAFLAGELALHARRGGGSAPGDMIPSAVSVLRRRLWAALQEHPTAVWFVVVDDGPLRPAWSPDRAVALLRRSPGPARVILAPPLLDD